MWLKFASILCRAFVFICKWKWWVPTAPRHVGMPSHELWDQGFNFSGNWGVGRLFP